jgi:hypothetical protein
MGVVLAFMGALAYVVRVYARLVELGAETPAKNPYVAEMYKLALGKLYSRSIPQIYERYSCAIPRPQVGDLSTGSPTIS